MLLQQSNQLGYCINMKKPQNYYCHRNPTETTTLPDHYELIDKIGEGAFGEVFKIFNKNTSAIEVLKRTKGDPDPTSKETEIMQKMNHSDGFARLTLANTTNNPRDIQTDRTSLINTEEKILADPDYLIMTLLGASLGSLVLKHTLNIIDLKRMAYQCITRLKQLHERGYVHRDIKPDNLLLGNQNNPHKIYVVDFGLSTTFKRSATAARKCYPGEVGTIKYCSIASHLGLQQFPKDDLEGLGYSLVYLMTGQLPWCSLPKGLDEEEKFRRICSMKQEISVDKLSEGVSCLKKYLKMVRGIGIGEQIDYGGLLRLFWIECEEGYCYSFCGRDCFARQKERGSKKEGSSQIDKDVDKENKDGSCLIEGSITQIRIPSNDFFSAKQGKLY